MSPTVLPNEFEKYTDLSIALQQFPPEEMSIVVGWLVVLGVSKMFLSEFRLSMDYECVYIFTNEFEIHSKLIEVKIVSARMFSNDR